MQTTNYGRAPPGGDDGNVTDPRESAPSSAASSPGRHPSTSIAGHSGAFSNSDQLGNDMAGMKMYSFTGGTNRAMTEEQRMSTTAAGRNGKGKAREMPGSSRPTSTRKQIPVGPYLGREMFDIYTKEGRGEDYVESEDDGGNDLFVGPPSPGTQARKRLEAEARGINPDAEAEIQRRRNKHLARYEAFELATRPTRKRYIDSRTRNKIWDRQSEALEKELEAMKKREVVVIGKLETMRLAREGYNECYAELLERGEDEEMVHREFDDYMELRSDVFPDFERLRKWA